MIKYDGYRCYTIEWWSESSYIISSTRGLILINSWQGEMDSTPSVSHRSKSLFWRPWIREILEGDVRPINVYSKMVNNKLENISLDYSDVN